MASSDLFHDVVVEYQGQKSPPVSIFVAQSASGVFTGDGSLGLRRSDDRRGGYREFLPKPADIDPVVALTAD